MSLSTAKLKTLLLLLAASIGIFANASYAQTLKPEEGVDADKVWTVEFSNDVDSSSVSEDTVYITDCSTGEKFSTKAQVDSSIVRIVHDEPFSFGSSYLINVDNVTDVEGNALTEDYTKRFTVAPPAQPQTIDLDDDAVREKYGAYSIGTVLYSFSYDFEKDEYFTYVIRGLVDSSNSEAEELKAYDIPENTTFTRTLDIYSLHTPSESIIDGIDLRSDLMLSDIPLERQVKMEFTKERPYWIEKISCSAKFAKSHAQIFAVAEDGRYSPESKLYRIQNFYFMLHPDIGVLSGSIRKSLDGLTHMPLEEIYSEMETTNYYKDIYEYHGFAWSDGTSFFNNLLSSRFSAVEKDDEYIYYNLSSPYGNESYQGGYRYRLSDGNIEKITPDLKYISAIDEDYIYYMDEQVVRAQKDGSNPLRLYFNEDSILDSFFEMHICSDYVYAHNRVSPDEIWRIQKDGSNPEMLIQQRGMLDGFAAGENGIFIALTDGIYQLSHDGTSREKIISGDYKILRLEDDTLYYTEANAFIDYDEYAFETSFLEGGGDSQDIIVVENNELKIEYSDGKYSIYTKMNHAGSAINLHVYITDTPLYDLYVPQRIEQHQETIFENKRGDLILEADGYDPGMHIYYRYVSTMFEDIPSYWPDFTYAGVIGQQ